MRTEHGNRYVVQTSIIALTLILSLSGCASSVPCQATKPTLESLTFQNGQMTVSKDDSAKLLKYINDLEYCAHNRIETNGR
jgi:hypothetical protein